MNFKELNSIGKDFGFKLHYFEPPQNSFFSIKGFVMYMTPGVYKKLEKQTLIDYFIHIEEFELQGHHALTINTMNEVYLVNRDKGE